MEPYDRQLGHRRAKRLRKELTPAETLLWRYIRKRQVREFKFRRQHPMGPYIVDFVCLERKLIIELDGAQHATNRAYDEMRSMWLESKGYRVLRFWNNDVFRNLSVVYDQIVKELFLPMPNVGPHPSLPHSWGRSTDKE